MTADPPARAVLYARVSRGDKQDARAQLLTLRQWASAREWTIDGEFCDEETGDPKRRRGHPPGLQRAIERVRLGKAQIVVVFDVSRLVRSGMGALMLAHQVHELGGKFASYHLNRLFDTTDRFAQLAVFFSGLVAEIELEITRARTKAGVERARAEGKVIGRPLGELPDLDQVRELRRLKYGEARVARHLGCSIWTARRALAALQVAETPPGSAKTEGTAPST